MQRAEHSAGPASFGRVLRELRLAAGLSQESLAEVARMSSGGIGVLERGIRRAPQRHTLELLARALNLSPADRLRFEAAAKRAGNARRSHRSETGGTPRHNLPYSLTSFIGRERAVTALLKYVTDYRLVTVSGAGGVGKTRLALETAHSLLVKFDDGVWLAELDAADTEVVANRVAETLGISTPESATNEDWMDVLVPKQQLLILDNCEHVLEECARLVQRLLARCPRLHVLVTSRERLHVIGERVFQLGPLEAPAAVQLFLDRAADACPDLKGSVLDEESLRGVRTICTQLDGIPFAIELAAARVPALSVKMIAANVGQRLTLLRNGSTSVPRHQTMHALIDWSYELLPDPHRRVFDDLAIFGNGSTLESAYEIGVGDVEKREELLDILSSLVDKSLVIVDFDLTEARYALLATTREYAYEKLVGRQRLDALARRHARAYLLLAQRMDELGNKSPTRAWHAQARSELENWRLALHWALADCRDTRLGQRLVCALMPVWGSLALAEGLKWCRLALEAVDAATPDELIADLEYTGGFLAFLAGDLNAALPLVQRALHKYRSLDDHRGAVKAETVMGRTLYELGRHAEAESALTSALQTATALGDPLLTAIAHQGLVLWAEDLDAARYHVDMACAIAKAECAKRVGLFVDMVAAEAHFRAGEKSAAIELAKEALAAARDLGDEFAVMRSLSNLSMYLLACDRYDESRDAAREALEFSHLAHGATTVTWALQHLATIAAERGERPTAARLFGFTHSRLAKLSPLGDISERSERRRLEAMLQSELAPSDLEHLALTGGEMSEAEAIEEAVR